LAGVVSSFDVAEVALKVVGEISVSDRQINKLVAMAGGQLEVDRDKRTEQYVNQPLPRVANQVEPAPDLAAVFCDGGRMRTRAEGQGCGVHQPHWRETKNAAFHRMQSGSWDQDPQTDLPECFRNQAYVEKLVKGLKNVKKEGREEAVAEEEQSPCQKPVDCAPPPCEWQPKTLCRTCVSSLATSEEFGPMMAAEADARGFFAAKKRAFLGDGLPYNWTIHRVWFSIFVAIVDFVHVVEYIFSAAKAIHHDPAAYWQQYLDWVTACWQGRASDVIDELRMWQERVGPVPPKAQLPDTDPRQAIHATLTYLTNNHSRMDYPCYRRQGLPVTSSLAESIVKQMNQRVKGTEKFWNDGASGEAILQLRAMVLCQDDRLQKWIRNRRISPFSPRCHARDLAISV
jgi:hypothetical protein